MENQPRSSWAHAATLSGPRPSAWTRSSLRPVPGRIGAWHQWLDLAWSKERGGRRGFLWLPVLFSAGIAIYFSAPVEPCLGAPLIAGLCASALAWRTRERPAMLALFLGAAVFFAGFLASGVRTWSVARAQIERAFSGTITGHVLELERRGGGARLTIALTAPRPAELAGVEHIRVSARAAQVVAGDHIRGRVTLVPPAEAAFPGGYDFRREAFFRKLGAVGRLSDGPAIVPAPEAMGWNHRIFAAVDRGRNAMADRILAAAGPEAGPIAAALVTGKRGQIAEEDSENLRAAGLYHVISISGLHMVLAAGLFFWIIRAALALSPVLAQGLPIKKIAALAAMVGACGYCVFAGAEVATERALIMTLTMLGAILIDRPALALRNLAIAALIVLAREPESLLGPSFQMSFAAVAALIAAHEAWQRRTRANPSPMPPSLGLRLLRHAAFAVAGIAATTLIATLATAPFTAYHFHRANLYGLIGNTLAIPLVSLLVMPAAVIGALLTPFGFDGPIWFIMGLGVDGMTDIAAAVASLAGSNLPVPRFSVYWLVLMVAGFLVLCLLVSQLRWFGALLIVAGAGWAAVPTRFDLAIDPSGRFALARGAGGLVLVGRSPSTFVLQQWLPALGDQRSAKDPALRQGARCDRNGCVARLHDGRVLAVVTDSAAFSEDCERAAIIVTALEAPPWCQRGGRLVFDHTFLSGHGAILIAATADGVRLVTQRTPESARPWFPAPVSVRRRADAAPSEDDRFDQ